MRINKLSAAIFLALGPLMAGQALADCQPTAATAPIDHGDDVVVCDDATGGPDTDGVNTGGGNDTITVVAGSSVTIGGGLAVIEAIDGNDSVVVEGSVTTTTENTYGISLEGNDNRVDVTATGTIATIGDRGDAISADGARNRLDNAGTISTAGRAAQGMLVLGDEAWLLNTGTISTTGEQGSAMAIGLSGSDGEMRNQGTITTAGSG